MVLSYPVKKNEKIDAPEIWTVKPRPELWSKCFSRFYNRIFDQYTFSDLALRQQLPAALAGGCRCGVCNRLLLNPGPACLECHPHFRKYIFYLYGCAIDDYCLENDFGIDRAENYVYAIRVIRKYFLRRWPTARKYRKYFRRFYTQEELPDYVLAGSEGLQPRWIADEAYPVVQAPRIRSARPNPGGHVQNYPAESATEPVAPIKLKWWVLPARKEGPDESTLPNPGRGIRKLEDTTIGNKLVVRVPDEPVVEPQARTDEPDSGKELPDEPAKLLEAMKATATKQAVQSDNPRPVAGVYRFSEKVRRLFRAREGPRTVVMKKGKAERGSDTWCRRLRFVAAGSPREFPRVNWNPG